MFCGRLYAALRGSLDIVGLGDRYDELLLSGLARIYLLHHPQYAIIEVLEQLLRTAKDDAAGGAFPGRSASHHWRLLAAVRQGLVNTVDGDEMSLEDISPIESHLCCGS